MKKKKPPTPWGNSYLFINLKFWKCAYCGKLIENRRPFSVTVIDNNPEPYIVCSLTCFKILVVKLEAQRHDRSQRPGPWVP